MRTTVTPSATQTVGLLQIKSVGGHCLIICRAFAKLAFSHSILGYRVTWNHLGVTEQLEFRGL